MYWAFFKALIVMLLFMNTIVSEEELGRVLKWWAIVAAVSIVPSFIHFILGPDTWMYQAISSIAGTHAGVLERGTVIVGTETVGRLLWAGVDANGRGAILLFPLGVSFAYFSVKGGREKLFWSVIMGLIVICIMGTFSRSGFIAMVMVALMYAFVCNYKAIIPIFAGGLIGFVGILFMPAIGGRIFSIKASVLEEGGSGRLGFWAQAVQLWLRSPIIGHGLRGTVNAIGYEVHNSYLSLLSDTGIIGCGLFCLLMFMSCRWFLIAGKYRDSMHMNFGKILFCGMFGCCAMIGTVVFYAQMTLWMAFAASFLFYTFQKNYSLEHDHLYIEEGSYQ